MNSFIKVEGLCKSFGQQSVLENVNFKVKKGESLGYWARMVQGKRPLSVY